MNDTIKPGMRFKNGAMDLTAINFYEKGRDNVALVQRSEDSMYITVRDLTHSRGEYYYWLWGHYFSKESKADALDDYEIRKKDL